MKFFYLLFFTSLTLLFSCIPEQESEVSIDNKTKNYLEEVSDSKQNLLIKKIEKIRYDSENNIKKIEKIKKVGELYLVDYLLKDGSYNNIAIEDLFTSKVLNLVNMNDRTVIYCRGNCGCRLESVLVIGDPSQDYTQCSCSPCAMHFADDYPDDKKNSKGGEKWNLKDVALDSYSNTFNSKNKSIKIYDILYETHEDVFVSTVFYKDNLGNQSTFMVLENNRNSSLGLGDPVTVVDCHGECDCRERYVHSTNSTECTCSPCVMDVTEK